MSLKTKNKFFYYLNKVFHHIYTQTIILLFSVFILFSSDSEVVFLPHSWEPFIIKFKSFLLIFFILEFILSNMFIKNFLFGFYFFIDFIDLLSLATEVYYVWNSIINALDNENR